MMIFIIKKVTIGEKG